MENKIIIKKVCNICSKEAEDGIIINGKIICYDCEKEIVRLDFDNKEKYKLYLDKLKRIILK